MTVDVELAGRRILVVGGSAGIGRAVALHAAAAGAEITVVGRSSEKLAEVIATAGGGSALVADVRDPNRCVGLVREAVDAMGELDVVLFASGITQLMPIGRIDPATLQDVFATNALGPVLVANAAVEHLSETGIMMFLSSISVRTDYQGNGMYAASKAALERAIGAFQLEDPAHRFVCVAVGDTSGTDIARSHDVALATELLPEWLASAAMYERQMDVADLGRALTELAAMLLSHPDIAMPNLTIVPHSPKRTGSLEEFMASIGAAPPEGGAA